MGELQDRRLEQLLGGDFSPTIFQNAVNPPYVIDLRDSPT